MISFLERLGGILIAPRQTLVRLVGDSHGGFNDLLLLLLLQATALRLPQIGRIGWHTLDNGVPSGALLLLSLLARAIMWPMVAAIVGGLVLRLAARREEIAGRATDVASLCVIPAVALQIVVSLLAIPFPTIYQPWLRSAVLWTGIAWLVRLLLLAATLLRGTGAAERGEAGE